MQMQRFERESDVGAQERSRSPARTFGAHRGARYKTLSHQQEPDRSRRWEVRGMDLLHQTGEKASP